MMKTRLIALSYINYQIETRLQSDRREELVPMSKVYETNGTT